MIEKELAHAKRSNKRPRIQAALGRMQNVDFRKELVFQENVFDYGGRVRQLDVSRNHPGIQVVIKHCVEGVSAPTVVERIKEKVRQHNQREVVFFSRGNVKRSDLPFELLEPYGYAIGENLIAMAKTDFPSVEEIVHPVSTLTPRAVEWIKKLKAKYQKTPEDLKAAAIDAEYCTGIQWNDYILAGVRHGKFIFVPLLDLHRNRDHD